MLLYLVAESVISLHFCTIESSKLELVLIFLQSKVKDIELKGHTDSVDQLCWDPNHPDTVATAAADKSIRLWDARSK